MTTKISYKTLIICILCCLYLLFPTHNSSTDAWYYAASVKYGKDLFLPHHLFHSAFLWISYKFISFFIEIDAMAFCKAMNGIFATILMAIFARFLAFFQKKDSEIAAWTFLVGVSFAVWRYATENETYILPLIFSLLASFFFCQNNEKNAWKNALLSGFLAALACLFHQLQIVWALGLGISWLFYGTKKEVFTYILPFLIVPIAYFSVYYLTISPDFSILHFMKFVLHDFHTGSAALSFGKWNIVLTVLNFFRSFLQIHASILAQIQGNYAYLMPIFIAIIFLFIVLKQMTFSLKNLHVERTINRFHFSFIFVLQIFFACLAVGNAEFMVMIPLLFALILAEKSYFSPQNLTFVGISLFIWNFTYSIVPQHYASEKQALLLQKHILAHPQDTYLLESRPAIANQLYYHTETWHFYHLQHAPAIWLSKGQNLDSLLFICDKTLEKGGHIFTDALQKNTFLNRESIRYEGNDSLFWRKYTWTSTIDAQIWEGK